MTNGDPEGRISLSHPQAFNGLFSLPLSFTLLLKTKRLTEDTDYATFLKLIPQSNNG